MDTIIEHVTLTNLALCAIAYLYYITTAGYYMGAVVPSGALYDFPYPRIARVLCLLWPVFTIAHLIQAYFEGGKKA